MEERPDQQQVDPADPVGHGGRVGRGLQEVPIDGEPVVRIPLGLVAHCRPLGHEPLEQATLIERFEGSDGAGPGGQQPHQRGPQ